MAVYEGIKQITFGGNTYKLAGGDDDSKSSLGTITYSPIVRYGESHVSMYSLSASITVPCPTALNMYDMYASMATCIYNMSNVKELCAPTLNPMISTAGVGPMYVNGDSVKRIRDGAMAFATGLKSARFINCETVGEYAFFNPSKHSITFDVLGYLSEVIIPNCRYIGVSAFRSCSSLTSITLSNCEYIGSWAFSGCMNLSTADLTNCEYIGTSAFYGTKLSLGSVTLPKLRVLMPGNNGFTNISAPNIEVLGNAVIKGNVTVSMISFSKLKHLGAYNFNFELITSRNSINLPACEFLADDALAITSTDSYWYSGKAKPSPTIRNVISFPACKYIGNGAFSLFTSDLAYMKSLNAPECRYIGYSAFLNQAILESVNVPECLYIGSSAFEGCFSLKTINAPKCLYIGPVAFGTESYASKPYYLWDAPYSQYAKNSSYISACDALTSVNMPSCQTIDRLAFYYCKGLKSVSFPACLSISSYALAYCSSLSSLVLTSLVSIGDMAFAGDSSISVIDLPHAKYVGGSAFLDCRGLRSLTFGYESVMVGSYAFMSCASLSYISFGSDVNIQYAAFSNCFSLRSIYLSGSTVAQNQTGFVTNSVYFNNNSTKIYVPASLYAAYKSSSSWSYWSRYIYSY